MGIHILSFNKDEVRKLIDHARACREHQPEYEQMYDPAYRKDGRTPPEGHWPKSEEIDMTKVPVGLHLAADHGVYLMSNGLPRDIVEGGRGGSMSRVVYAEGINPDKDDDWWERKRAVMGGDDSVLFFAADDIVAGMKAPTRTLNIGIKHNGQYVTETSIYLR